MKALKWLGVVLVAYVGLVFAFEVLYLGWYQPKLESMRVAAEFPIPFPVRIMMGFPPPREILRLEPAG